MVESNMTKVRNLYLDLISKVLVNSIYCDPDFGPWSSNLFDAATRAVGRDWPRTAHTMVGLARLTNLRELVQRTLEDNVPGDYIETGVWRGGCCIMIKAVLSSYDNVTRKVFVADSFEGLPMPNNEYPADFNDQFHIHEELAVSLDQVKLNFEKYDLLDPHVVFVKGWFKDTLPTLDAGPFALIRLDGDMYESTILALDHLYPKLSPGGYTIIDDYGCVEGCRKAVDDYRTRHKISAPMTSVDWTGTWWQKPLS
jgi:O-methyltransferase